VAIFGLGPIGQMSSRIARQRGARVIAVDLVPERIEMARRRGIEVLNAKDHDDVPAAIRQLTDGRGTDSAIDAVGMEAHGSPGAQIAQRLTGLLPDAVASSLMEKAAIDRLAALSQCIDTVRRAGTISIIGVYGGMIDPLPMLTLFDKGIQLRMGQAHVKRWINDLMPLVTDDADPLGVEDLATHRLPLEQAPHGYEIFQKKEDGAIKVVLHP
jgi:threonine dehydrogenase-like Zn-dependent dehydrogenase